ncbi:hypothetical protein IVB25_40175 [Bradyrhizobium sp. 193]|uniref:DUF5625 family protein n=1 Tax=unclassified Bradyrhizobium TaxID=2631580 RepID=UPI000377F56C|nr:MULTISPECIES: DUF5625 family protein [unclassified Bradyrhizobium]MCK1345468.1 hypothetical protein [Bradyrhizobium sp. CW11]MCK1466258.1 hypothetical protein [Bradyrhizobium sp. CW10]MCK1488734.1 hypothetical protein [Bradyrhizobium sp. 193]MCK1581782.1 hypothetical protein [Bradyrhizobium sp. 168]MCK1586016.1 hypothetical protein [Bradyrhizobium sp. 169]
MFGQSWHRALCAVLLFVLAVGVFRIAGGWAYGEPPYVQYLKWAHHDIPRFTVPARLIEATPFTFQAQIIGKKRYELNLVVYSTGPREEAALEALLGGPIAQPINAGLPPGKLPTKVHVTVQDQERRVVFDQTRSSDGIVARTAFSRARELALLPLDEGRYTVTVTPLSDMTALSPFRTEIEVTYSGK